MAYTYVHGAAKEAALRRGAAALFRAPRAMPPAVRRQVRRVQDQAADLPPRAELAHAADKVVDCAVGLAAVAVDPALLGLDLVAPVVEVPQVRVCPAQPDGEPSNVGQTSGETGWGEVGWGARASKTLSGSQSLYSASMRRSSSMMSQSPPTIPVGSGPKSPAPPMSSLAGLRKSLSRSGRWASSSRLRAESSGETSSQRKSARRDISGVGGHSRQYLPHPTSCHRSRAIPGSRGSRRKPPAPGHRWC